MPNSAAQPPILDHIVILISHTALLGISQHTEGKFTLAPGGNHADGLTTNKLILLSDGVYLEFIAFFDNIDPERRRNHRWGNEKEGTIIDWAFTLPSESDFSAVQQRLAGADVGLSYTHPIPGGRTKPDGTILEWAVCAPRDDQDNAVAPGSLPFWCLDRTPREKRVPYHTEARLTRHPNGVQGISSVSVHVPEGHLANLKGAYDAVFDGSWCYEVPSGSRAGKRTVSLLKAEGSIGLVFNGAKSGHVELLPGLWLEMENSASR